MSIVSKLQLLQQDITNARTAITAKGGTVTSGGGSSQLATDIATIPSGGGSKYGATVNSFVGDIDNNGRLQFPSEDTYFDFTGVRMILDYGFYYRFTRHTNIKGLTLSNLIEIGTYGLANAFQCTAAVRGNINTLSMPNLNSVANYGLQYAFHYQDLSDVELNLSQLIIVGTNAFAYAFQESNLKAFYTHSLTSISGSSSFNTAFAGIKNNNFTVRFNNLATINVASIFTTAFQSSYLDMDKVSHPFPDLVKINNYNVFQNAFKYCMFTRIVFDKLEYIGDVTAATYNVFGAAFQYTLMHFENGHDNDYDRIGLFCPSLKEVGKNSSSSRGNFSGAFTSSNNRHTAHFYDLTTIYNTSSTSSYGQFASFNAKRVYMPKVTDMGINSQTCFYNSTSTEEIHFGIENQATITAMTGYASKFGATNATIYFDMVNRIAYNGILYRRDGANCDLDNWYFAWANPVTPSDIIYTTNFKDPAVGDTVYAKSGTTYTSVGTIGGVA